MKFIACLAFIDQYPKNLPVEQESKRRNKDPLLRNYTTSKIKTENKRRNIMKIPRITSRRISSASLSSLYRYIIFVCFLLMMSSSRDVYSLQMESLSHEQRKSSRYSKSVTTRVVFIWQNNIAYFGLWFLSCDKHHLTLNLLLPPSLLFTSFSLLSFSLSFSLSLAFPVIIMILIIMMITLQRNVIELLPETLA